MRTNIYRLTTIDGTTLEAATYAAALKAVRKTFGWRSVPASTWEPDDRSVDRQRVWRDEDQAEEVAVITRVCVRNDWR